MGRRLGASCRSAHLAPHLERRHDNVSSRAGDLDQLEQIAGTYPIRLRPPAPRRCRRISTRT